MNDQPDTGPEDVPLDDDLARRLISAQFPRLGPVRITARYGGVDHHAVEVDAAWIFRFPKRAECAPMLVRELALLPHVAPLFTLPVPHYEFVGAPTPDFPFAFAGYRKLAGTPAIDRPPEMIVIDDLAACLGGILSTLHAFPSEAAGNLGVVRLEDYEGAASQRASTLEELEQIHEALPGVVLQRCRAFVGHGDSGTTPWPGPPRLLHGDLSAEHLLLDPRTGRVSGLIDWADACLGDPAYDLKFLWAWLGEEFVARVLGHYAGPVDPGFLGRVRFYGACTAVGEVAYGLTAGREANLRLGLAALDRAFARLDEESN